MRSGFISIVGRPNVGKSTLLNAILGEKISITTEKPQTTRNNIRGIYTENDLQIVFLDTPGIHKAKTKLGEFMTDSALGSFKDADLIVFLVEDDLESGKGDKFILDKLTEVQAPKILVINKIDKLEPDKFKKIYDEYDALGLFDNIFGISALDGQHVEDLLNTMKTYMPEGPAYYPEDMIADHPMKFIASELIREKLLLYLKDEVPHGIAVEIESFEELPTIINISAVIYCEKKSHKSIIIGKEGKKLKGVGKAARKDLEEMLDAKVFLKLWVKIKEDWRNSDSMLSSFGYKEKE